MAAPPRSVLIVDRSAETRELLRTVLQQRGLNILEAGAAGDGLALARQHHPDLIVLDLEVEPPAGEHLPEGYVAQSQREQMPLLVLGSARRAAPGVPREQFVSKPYHYAPLIRKIESLLDSAHATGPDGGTAVA